ncbi:MAG: hypothetical protein AAF965_04005 [Pseudomonadota bacterium]
MQSEESGFEAMVAVSMTINDFLVSKGLRTAPRKNFKKMRHRGNNPAGRRVRLSKEGSSLPIKPT